MFIVILAEVYSRFKRTENCNVHEISNMLHWGIERILIDAGDSDMRDSIADSPQAIRRRQGEGKSLQIKRSEIEIGS
jgi:hypothetical protein